MKLVAVLYFSPNGIPLYEDDRDAYRRLIRACYNARTIYFVIDHWQVFGN